ncbi:MurR/RpiR family transcriptional regulator [Ornithinibacillus halophilus]|uniref:Transcriptional regulator, RpiR family n=1 Tax=Ornithinibacillus halophilus TaxID=930117 RepID=A0A1M5HM25_9BACI|nr:MurR/RpiR family transcriptional regulator [Ornithinibacillus halophilus]SHG17003.1 transcriptional regulator, RpiR family [Ornithinibacillus halophilus]
MAYQLDDNNVNLSLLMEQNKNTYTKSEQKLYTYITENFEQIVYQSLTELAIACQVGEATVLRFCRKLGCKGYQEFKLSLARELSNRDKNNNHGTYIDKVRNNMIQAIEDTHHLVDDEQLQKAVEMINEAKTAVIYGVSSSGIAGLDMQNRLMRIGVNFEVITDSHNQVIRSNSVNKDTVIIAISLTGSTKDIINAVKIGKDNGAKVIAITNYMKSPLTQYADSVLLTSAKENPLDSGSLVSKISQLFVIDLLCTGITMANYEKAKQTKEQIAHTIANKLY